MQFSDQRLLGVRNEHLLRKVCWPVDRIVYNQFSCKAFSGSSSNITVIFFFFMRLLDNFQEINESLKMISGRKGQASGVAEKEKKRNVCYEQIQSCTSQISFIKQSRCSGLQCFRNCMLLNVTKKHNSIQLLMWWLEWLFRGLWSSCLLE